MKNTLLLLFAFASSFVFSQDAIFNSACQQAYAAYPNLPKGVIEATAYTQTRFSYLTSSELESCSGLPKSHGYLGMVRNGKNYFKENMGMVSTLSGYSLKSIQENPSVEIMAYAKAFHDIYSQSVGQPMELRLKKVFSDLSYLADSGIVNQFARDAELLEVFRFLNKTTNASQFQFPAYHFNLELVFGAANLGVLTSTKVTFQEHAIVGDGGLSFEPQVSQLKSTEYGPAIWNPAPACNFSSRSGTAISAITIHTIQGTYAGAISWSQNCSSSVSYHYVVRSSDGQITQMVNEANKAWHVGSENPYTIGYEHEGYVSQASWYTMAMYNASAGITRDICQSGYGINPLRTFSGTATSGSNVLGSCIRIKGHQHYPNQTHTDPGIYWNWALYYTLVNNAPTQTTVTTATGTFTDTGGAAADYSNDQRYFTLIQPANASSISLNFSSFNLEANWDYMYIYDGSTTNAALIGTYTGTTSPGTITSSGGSLLIEFRSDCATTASGWQATWSSTIQTPTPVDAIAPSTAISAPSTWVTQAFTADFTDADNVGGSGLEKAYYQVIDYDGTDWRANATKGFFSDNFDQTAIHTDWTNQTGVWSLSNGNLVQTDEANGNSNIHAFVNHSLSNRYLYHWAGSIDGAGTNRRAGMHYFCSDPTLTNRGNSYFVFFRLDDDKAQIYEVSNDVFTLVNEVSFDFTAGTWYDFKVIYDRISGKHQVYIDNVLIQTWVDSTPLSTGNYLSFRSGNSVYSVNNLKVYRSRFPSLSVGVGASEELRYQSVNPSSPGGRIKSIVQDSTGNLSSIASQDVYVDWTAPSTVASINDGLGVDITTTTNNTLIEANWSTSLDTHSDIARYWVAVGTTPGGTDIADWTDNYWNTNISLGGLSLITGTTYYVSVKVENGAGLFSAVTTSNGQQLIAPSDPPVASFTATNANMCAGETITFQNNSINGTSYSWSFQNGTPATSTAIVPSVSFPSSGTYTVDLIVSGPGGSDTVSQQIQVQVSQPIVADFSVNDTILFLPSAILTCANQSQNANGYLWDFGDGSTSQDVNPWHMYTQTGFYTVLLTGANNACPSDTLSILVEVRSDLGLSELENQVIIYPNPATEEVHIVLNQKNASIVCLDVSGRIVYEGKIQDGVAVMNVKQFAKGVYQLYIKMEDKFITKPFIIAD